MALCEELKAGVTYGAAFACEKVPAKAKFIHQYVHGALLDTESCIFADICEVGENFGVKPVQCLAHQRLCAVPGHRNGSCILIAIAGWSCKDLSRMNANFAKTRNNLRGQQGSSGKTLQGLVSYLAASPVKAYIGENVDELNNLSGDARQYLEEASAR